VAGLAVTGTRIAVDIGGTFTDVVAFDPAAGRYRSAKVLTTPEDRSVAVIRGMAAVTERPTDVASMVHGTTTGLNAFLERRGEKVMLVTTRGIRDVYHIARGHRTSLYEVQYRKPEPLVPRADIVEVAGRLDYRGVEVEPLDEEALRAAARRARDEAFGSVAVAFLFSYLEPAHELRARQVLREEVPELSVSLSHEVAREWREYERTSSTVVEAYIAPTVRGYLERLEESMAQGGYRVGPHVMQSNGGVITAASATARPLQTLLSGPAGGAAGGAALASETGLRNLICIDMGGTSFDVSLIVDGRAHEAAEIQLEGHPLLTPAVEIHTIGAGGGSVAYLEGGGLRVGPRSAGADPGPACYGRGGTEPTVTDANLLLGRLDARHFGSGTDLELDQGAAEAAVAALAGRLGIDTLRLAEGILDVINAQMAQAIRTITVEQGIEPRDFAILAFGGAGPMHAAFLAQELEIPEVVVPTMPGSFSAWGMLQSAVRRDVSAPFFRPADEVAVTDLHEVMRGLGDEVVQAVEDEGVARDAIRVEHFARLRYVGQEYWLSVPLDRGVRTVAEIVTDFDGAHDARYGHSSPGAPVEFVTVQAVGLGERERPGLAPVERVSTAQVVASDARTAIFSGREVETAVHERAALAPGTRIAGPCVITEDTSTIVVPPGCRCEVGTAGIVSLIRDGVRERRTGAEVAA
jgi:N-methylhydantoinase A